MMKNKGVSILNRTITIVKDRLIPILCVILVVVGLIPGIALVDAATLNTRGDVNGDGQTNIVDLVHMKHLLLKGGERRSESDINGDGFINDTDLHSLKKLLGEQQYESIDRLELYSSNIQTTDNVKLMIEEGEIGNRNASLIIENTSEENGWPAIYIPFNERINFNYYESFHLDMYFEGIHPWIQIGFMSTDWQRLPGGDNNFKTVSMDVVSDEWCSLTVSMDEYEFDKDILSSIGGIIIYINVNDNVRLNEQGKSYIGLDNLNFNKAIQNISDSDLAGCEITPVDFTGREEGTGYWNDLIVQDEVACNSNEALLIESYGYNDIASHIQLRFESCDWSDYDEINVDFMFQNVEQYCEVKLITISNYVESTSNDAYTYEFSGDGWQNLRVELTTMLDKTVNLEKVIGIDIGLKANCISDTSQKSQIYIDNIYGCRSKEDTDYISLYYDNEPAFTSDFAFCKIQPYETYESSQALQIYTNNPSDNDYPQYFMKFYELKDLSNFEKLHFNVKAEGAHPWISFMLTDKSGNIIGKEVGRDYETGVWKELIISLDEFGIDDETKRYISGIKINTYFPENEFNPNEDGTASIFIDNLYFTKPEDSQLIYSVPDTDTYLRDGAYNLNVGNADTSVSVETGKNETVSFQLLVTPTEKVEEYSFKISNLVCGDSIISSKDIEVYTEKYVLVTETVEDTLVKGWYPDALVSIDRIIHYNENSIAASDNQGFWINVNVPEDAKAGIYVGKIIFIADGVNHEVPVYLRVYDVNVPEEVHMTTAFGIDWFTLEYGEGVRAHTSEIQWSYYDFLTEHRLAAQTAPLWGTTDEYIEYVVKLAENSAISSYRLPYDTDEENNLSYSSVVELLSGMVNKNISLIKNGKTIDLFDKAYFYLATIIDEPSPSNYSKVQTCNTIIYEAINESAKLITDELIKSYPYLSTIRDSLLDLQHIVTTGYVSALDRGEGVIDTWCPLFSNYEENMQKLEISKDNGAHIWWYGCIFPTSPYPTYHLDDNLASSRILAWMQFDYNIEGNLYWCVNHFRYYKEQYYKRNFWKYALSWENCNGEGMLVYPGLKYGIDGPISTLRLESIREGQEDYEYFWLFEKYIEKYNNSYNQNLNSDELLDEYFEGMYSGTKVTCDADTYKNNRSKLLKTLDSMSKDLENTVSELIN